MSYFCLISCHTNTAYPFTPPLPWIWTGTCCVLPPSLPTGAVAVKRVILCSGESLLALTGPNSRILKQNEGDQLVKFSGLSSICSGGFAQLWCECASMPWKSPFSCVGSISPHYRHWRFNYSSWKSLCGLPLLLLVCFTEGDLFHLL